MKVLIINTLYHPYAYGGAEKSVQILAEELVKQGVEVIVVATGKQFETNIVNGVKVYYVGLKNLHWQFNDSNLKKRLLNPIWHVVDSLNPLMASAVANIVDIERPNIVHTNNIQGFSVLVWQKIKNKKIPIVHTVRDYYLICPKTLMFDKSKGRNCHSQCFPCRAYSLPRVALSHTVDAVVGITKFVVEQHTNRGLFKNTNTFVIPNSYSANNSIKNPSINSFNILRYGYIGRLNQAKGIELLLKSFSHCQESKCSLTIAGRGHDKYLIKLKSQYSHENIKFIGVVPAEEFFKQIDVLVVPPIWNEPFGRTIIEAYAQGIPVIASKRGGIPDLVEEGITGYLFEPDKPEELLSYLQMFIARPELVATMSQSCRKKAEEFSPDRTVEQYLNIYKELIFSN